MLAGITLNKKDSTMDASCGIENKKWGNSRNTRKGVKYVQLWNKDTRTSSISTFWCLYGPLWTYFTPCSDVSILNFEYVIVGRDKMTFRYLENTF